MRHHVRLWAISFLLAVTLLWMWRTQVLPDNAPAAVVAVDGDKAGGSGSSATGEPDDEIGNQSDKENKIHSTTPTIDTPPNPSTDNSPAPISSPPGNPVGDDDNDGVDDDDQEPKIDIVVAKTLEEDTNWVSIYFPRWTPHIYIVDSPDAALTVPVNKGREAMVYLTYIIDRYDSLPSYSIFHHAGRVQWHNDIPGRDAIRLLNALRFDHVKKEGYVNLRCAWVPGCPLEIRPMEDFGTTEYNGKPLNVTKDPTAKHIYRAAFEELFPGIKVPKEVGAPCCSQFAVTREAIRRHERADYMRLRDWLINNNLEDSVSGRFFEYSWHIIFGKDPVTCPGVAKCFCGVYGNGCPASGDSWWGFLRR